GALYENLQRINNDLETLAKQRKAEELKIVRLETQLAALGKPPVMPESTSQPASEPASQPTTHPSSQPTTQPVTLPTSLPVEWVYELNPEKKRLEDQMQQFKQQLNMALTIGQMKDKHPTVKTLRAKIAELEERAEAEPEWITVRKTVSATGDSFARQFTAQMILADIAAAKSELEAGDKEIERLQKQRETLQELMGNFAPVRQEYEQIVEKVKKQVAERDRWRRQLSEVQMALDAEDEGKRTHLNVLQVAQEQILPSSPKLLMVLSFAIIGGLAFGGGLVLASNHWDRSVSTTDDAIKYFDVPIFGITSEIVSGRQRAVRRLRRWVIGPIVLIIVLACLTVSALSVTLWLKYPQKHEEWKASPITFVSGAVTGFARDASELF
ncbi:MAG: hypothetical protein K8R91_01855, partial [Phycisphaerae bacterium]|nr:hypothetical protein [Phycisphaerae bacterium]